MNPSWSPELVTTAREFNKNYEKGFVKIKTMEQVMNDPFEKDWKADEPAVVNRVDAEEAAKELLAKVGHRLQASGKWGDVRFDAETGSLERFETAPEEDKTVVSMNAEGRMEYVDDCQIPMPGPAVKATAASTIIGRGGSLPQEKEDLAFCKATQQLLWDRYFEIAFRSLMDKWNISERGVAEKAADYADEMLAERNKRAK